jgi:hypothetical protein
MNNDRNDLIADYWTAPTPPVSPAQWQSVYEKQRRDRLGDIIVDYLGDETVTPRRVYEELLAEVDSYRKYHKEGFDRANELYDLLLGFRPGELTPEDVENGVGG